MGAPGRFGLLLALLGCLPSEDLGSYTGGAWPNGVTAPAEGQGGSSAEPAGGVGSSADPEAPMEAPGVSGAGEGELPDELDPGTAGNPASGPGGSGSTAAPPDTGGSGGTAADPVPALAPEVRFVRLIADSAIAQDPYTSMAEFSVLDEMGEPIDTAGWLASADSAEQAFVGGAPPEFAIDGLADTMWHTPWFEVVPPPHPHVFEVDLGQLQHVSGFRYLPRQDGAADGRIEAYQFFVSVDGVGWGEPLLVGRLGNSNAAVDVRTAP